LGFHVEVNFSRFPIVAGFRQEGGDQTEEGRFIREDTGDAGAALEFLIDAFQGVGGAQSFLVGEGQGKDRQTLRQIFFHPSRKFGGAVGVVGDDFLEAGFGSEATGAIKHAADGTGDFLAQLDPGHIRLGVLLQVKLAALPRDGPKDGFAGGGHAGVVVADDAQSPAEAALDKALEEGSPMDFGFAEGDADAEQGTLASGGDAEGDEDGAIPELAIMANLFVAGVKHQIGIGAERAGTPFLEFGVEEFGAVANLGGTDAGAAEFFHDGGDFPGGDALDIHFSQGEFEGLFGANAFFQGAGIEGGFAADLWDAKGDGPNPAGERFGFVAVGIAEACVRPFVRLSLEDLMPLDAHGFIDEQAQAFGEALVALFRQKLQDVVQKFRIGVVGHVRFDVGCVC